MSVSARGAAAPRTGAGELHRQCFASVGQCAVAQIWPRLACASWLAFQFHRCWCSHATAKLHNAAFWKVLASRSAKAPLGVAHRFAPSRVSKTGVMQSGLRWSRSHSRRRFPVAFAPYAPPPARPCGCRGTVALVRRCALCFDQWPAANHVVCAPARPKALPRRCPWRHMLRPSRTMKPNSITTMIMALIGHR